MCMSDCLEFYRQHLFEMLLGIQMLQYSSNVNAIIYQGDNVFSWDDNALNKTDKKTKQNKKTTNTRTQNHNKCHSYLHCFYLSVSLPTEFKVNWLNQVIQTFFYKQICVYTHSHLFLG